MKAKVSCLTKTEAIYDHLLKNLKATKSIEYQLAWVVEKKITRDCISNIAAGGVIGVPECFAYCSFSREHTKRKKGEKSGELLASWYLRSLKVGVPCQGSIDILQEFKMESIRKLSNFNFQWTKTLYQNNLNNTAFFFTFFKGYRYN